MSMTKEELKNALINHGLSPPPASAKKEEFLAMYEEHVAPIDNDAGEFSSDDEVTLSPKKKVSQSSTKSTSSSKASKKGRKSTDKGEESSLVVGDLDIDALEDEELFNLLKENGVDVGPIVASTRPFYKKKLALVLKGESMNGTANGSANGDTFSDTEPEDEEDQPSAVISPKAETRTSTRSRVSSSSKKSNKSVTQSPPPAPASEPRTGLRKRINIADEIDSSMRNTPTPRRSIHTYKITETTRTTEVLNKDGVKTRDTERILERSQSAGTLDGKATSSFPWRKVLVVLLILAILVAAGLYLSKQKGAMSVDSIMDSLKESIKSAPAPSGTAAPTPAPTPAPRQAMPEQPAVADV